MTRSNLWPDKVVKYILISLITFLVIATSISTAWGQISHPVKDFLPDSSSSKAQASTQQTSSQQVGTLIFAPITIDGREIFRVAATESESAAGKEVQSPFARRVKIIQDRFYKIIKQGFDPEALEVSISLLNNQTVIFVSDYTQEDLTRELLVTITPLDAQLYGLPLSVWSKQLQQIIYDNLIRAQQERQPQYLLIRGLIFGGTLVGMILASLGLRCLQKRLKAQLVELESQKPSSSDDSVITSAIEGNGQEISTTDLETTVAAHHRQLNWQLALNLNNLNRLILQIGQIAIWVAGLAWMAGLFPWTRWLQSWLSQKPLSILLVLVGINLLVKIANFGIDRGLAVLTEELSSTNAEQQRKSLRLGTLVGVLKGLSTILIILIGFILLLYVLEIPIAPVLAGAGIVGLGISLASQDLLKDIINGTLILLEDRYAVGDFITITGIKGQVEKMNLRLTEIRDITGTLSTIPHGGVAIVQNHTKHWSRVNFTIEVSCKTDVVKAMAILRQVAEEMAQDWEWGEKIVDPVNVLGVDEFAHSGIRLLIRIKTQPGEQWDIEREFRRRLTIAFEREGIALGVPQRQIISAQQTQEKVIN
ncbi:MAG: mechanosensitive ion channel family protein [Xenococcaceae cyanobacterium MO_207.B15]|nr:mechanosensitive ion channel family protein [Xenococcaceae cyanobacterium MO_207.B15]